jgi:hypothetical protein
MRPLPEAQTLEHSPYYTPWDFGNAICCVKGITVSFERDHRKTARHSVTKTLCVISNAGCCWWQRELRPASRRQCRRRLSLQEAASFPGCVPVATSSPAASRKWIAANVWPGNRLQVPEWGFWMVLRLGWSGVPKSPWRMVRGQGRCSQKQGNVGGWGRSSAPVVETANSAVVARRWVQRWPIAVAEGATPRAGCPRSRVGPPAPPLRSVSHDYVMFTCAFGVATRWVKGAVASRLVLAPTQPHIQRV